MDNQKQKKVLAVFSDDMLAIQSPTSYMKINFLTPILEAYEFLERYEKYNLKSELLSIPISVKHFDTVYSDIKQSVEEQFQCFLGNSIKCIQEMVLSCLYYKIQKYHYFNKCAESFKKKILKKNIDCYGFNPSAFTPKAQRVLDIVDQVYQGVIKRDEKTKIEMGRLKQEIKDYQRQMEENEARILNKDMFVKNPYVAQNTQNRYIDPNLLFKSYMEQLKYLANPVIQGFKIKQYDILKSASTFYTAITEISLRLQTFMYDLIRDYNLSRHHQNNRNIITERFKYREITGSTLLDGIEENWALKNKKSACLQNKLDKVVISENVIVFDESTKDLSVETHPYLQKKVFVRDVYKLDAIEEDKIPMPNQYFDFWNFHYDRKKLRAMHEHKIGIGKPTFNVREIVLKRMKQTWKDKIKPQTEQHRRRFKQFTDVYSIKTCIYSDVFKNMAREQKKIWEEETQSYQIKIEETNSEYETSFGKTFTYDYQRREYEAELQQKMMKEREQFYQQNQRYEEKHKTEMSMKAKIDLLVHRNYKTFCESMEIPYSSPSFDDFHILRYNLKLSFTIEDNQPVKLEQFMCFYIREKLYKQNPSVSDKKSNFIIFYSKSIENFCCKNSIQFLIKKIKKEKLKKFILWGTQIIMYEEVVNPNKQVEARFYFYPFSEIIYTQRIVFELKRYAPFPINATIEMKTYQKNIGPYDKSMKKLQLVSRLALKSHIPCTTPDTSQEKGRFIYEKMMEQILQ